MRNVIRAVAVAGLLILVAVPGGWGHQAERRLTFKAAFDFQVENRRLPAGEYSVLVQNGWLQILGKDGKSNANVLTLPVSREGAAAEKAEIVFHEYKGRYFLAEVWIAESGKGREVLESTDEKKIAKEQRSAALKVPLQPEVSK
jgi:hypothetical protein